MENNQPHPSILAKARVRNQVTAGALEHLQAHQAMLAAMLALPAMIVVWAVAAFAGALITSGGPLALFRGWLQAVTGL
jgi:hypothetical protein